MLRASDLSVRYGQIVAVRGARLSLDAGEMCALVGPNGSGKTSTLAALAGTVRASGTVSLDGVDVSSLPAEDRAAAGLAMVHDGRRLFGRLSVEQNLVVGATTIHGSHAARAAVDEVLTRFPLLAARARQRAATLSGGEGQLLAIARALVASPKVVLCDEPFQGLSAEARAFVLDALRDVAARGASVLLASPDPIEDLRTIHIRHGEVAEVLV